MIDDIESNCSPQSSEPNGDTAEIPNEQSQVANERDISGAVRQVTEVFNKPKERDKLYDAVYAAVIGQMTIKEASVHFGIATSTMHPYVHRARASLGNRAPVLKSMRIPPNKGNSLPVKSKKRKSETPLSNTDLLDEMDKDYDINKETSLWSDAAAFLSDDVSEPDPELNSLLLAAAATSKNTEEKVDDAETLAETMSPAIRQIKQEYLESAEDAAREAIEPSDLGDGDRQQLFLAIVRCINGDCQPVEAANCHCLSFDTVVYYLNNARALMGLEPVDKKQPPEPKESSSGGGGAFVIPHNVSIEDVARRITNGSHYHGSNKERLFKAVIQTVKGELPLTQAAATHSIPFSTLHPYVKKVRLVMGQIEPDEDKDARLLSGLKDFWNGKRFGPNTSSNGSPPVKKIRRQVFTSPNQEFRPFKRIEIPQSWKNNMKTMERIIREAVQNCQYDDPSKKERLYSAVLEALSGKKTMKAAAAMYLVPFTTLQTYFHRSRAALQRATGEIPPEDSSLTHDPEMPDLTDQNHEQQPQNLYHKFEPKDYQEYSHKVQELSCKKEPIEVKREPNELFPKMDLDDLDDVKPEMSLMLGSAATNNDKLEESIFSPKRSGGVWAKLRQRLEDQQKPNDQKCSDLKLELDQSLSRVGANKRKPKKVIRNADVSSPFTLTQDPDEEWLSKFHEPAGSSDDYLREFQGLWPTESGSNDRMEIVEPKAPEELDNYFLNLSSSTNEDEEEIEGPWPEMEKNDKFDDDMMEPLDNDELDNYEKNSVQFTAEVAIDKSIQNSHYEGLQRIRLRKALLDGLKSRQSLKSAASTYGVPLGTLHTYYHRAKTMLDAVEAGEDAMEVMRMSASAVNAAARRKKDIQSGLYEGLANSGNKDAVVEEAVLRVVRSSLYPPEQKQRLRHAVLKVVKGELTINAAANLYHLPSSTVHPYVHRARAAVETALPNYLPSSSATSTPPPDSESPGFDKIETDEMFEKRPGVGNIFDLETKSARATLKEVKEAKMAESKTAVQCVNLEEADNVVTALVKKCLYDEDGRQRLYEAVLMVVTDTATASEAARTYQIPPSTIQPYVQRARASLNLPNPISTTPPINGHELPTMVPSNSPGPNRKGTKSGCAQGTPMIYAKPGLEANEEEIYEVVKRVVKVVKQDPQHDMRRENLLKAVYWAVSGKSTIKDACTTYHLPASTVHPYVSRARHILGSKCPPPKIVVTGTPPSKPPTQVASTLVTPSGITVKANIKDCQIKVPASLQCQIPQKSKFKKELTEILSRYNFRGEKAKLVDAIAYVIGEKKTLADASLLTGIAQTTLSTYVRIAKLFLRKDIAFDGPELEPEISSNPVVSNNSKLSDAPPLLLPAVSQGENDDKCELSNNCDQLGVILPEMFDSKCDQETRLQAIAKYLVGTQYKRGKQAQEILIEAIEDVLLNGLSPTETLKSHVGSGLSENVLNVYVGRAKAAQALFDHPFSDLQRRLHLATKQKQTPPKYVPPSPQKRTKKSPVIAPQPSPTRISRRLQAKAEKEKLVTEMDKDIPETFNDQLLTPESEKSVVAFIKRLESVNFPLSSPFVIKMMTGLRPENCTYDWLSWWNAARKANGFK